MCRTLTGWRLSSGSPRLSVGTCPGDTSLSACPRSPFLLKDTTHLDHEGGSVAAELVCSFIMLSHIEGNFLAAKTHHWGPLGTSWPDCGEDSLQRIERLELLRDRRTRRSTKHETCGTQRTRQRDARPRSGTSCRAAAVWRSYTCRDRAGRLMSGSST